MGHPRRSGQIRWQHPGQGHNFWQKQQWEKTCKESHPVWKIFVVEKSIQTIILKAVDEPFVKALKEEYIGYSRRITYKMIVHLRMMISKVTNRDKLQLKVEVFIAWEQPQVLSMYFKQIEKAKKQLAKWNITISDDDIINHVIYQMHESDWFSYETMTKWEKTNNNRSIRHPETIQRCKKTNATKHQRNWAKEWYMYLNPMVAKATQERKEHQEHIHQVTNQNATLVTIAKEQQKKI